MANSLITEYCLPCLYCRRLAYSSSSLACHYTYDTGMTRTCSAGDGCVHRIIANDDERRKQAANASSGFVIRHKIERDRALDDYIWDTRGEL